MTSVLESILTLPPLKFFPLAVVTLMGKREALPYVTVSFVSQSGFLLKLLYSEIRAWGTIVERGKVFDDIKENA